MTNALAKPVPAPMTLRDLLQGDAFKASLANVLPTHMTADRFVRVALAATKRTPALAKCEQKTVLESLMLCSQYGLEPDGRRAHLVAYGTTCQLIIDYKGLAELLIRGGRVLSIHADAVCANDDFVYDSGVITRHVVDWSKPRGEPYAYCVIVRMRGGGVKCEVMTTAEVDAVRNSSRAANTGPWKSHYGEMAKKTVFRRATKWLPLTADIRDHLDKEDAIDLVDVTAHSARSSRVDAAETMFSEMALPAGEAPDADAPDGDAQADMVEQAHRQAEAFVASISTLAQAQQFIQTAPLEMVNRARKETGISAAATVSWEEMKKLVFVVKRHMLENQTV